MTTTVSSGVTSSGLNISSGSPVAVKSGGVIEYSTVLSGGSLALSAGAIGSSLFVGSGGMISGGGVLIDSDTISGVMSGVAVEGSVNLGGSAFAIDIQSNGYLYVNSGGLTSGTILQSGGTEQVESGGVASGVSVEAYGGFSVFSGGSSYDLTVSGEDSSLYNYSGVISNVSLLDGAIFYNYGVVSGAKVHYTGTLDDFGWMTNEGISYNDVISSGGIEYVQSGLPSTASSAPAAQ